MNTKSLFKISDLTKEEIFEILMMRMRFHVLIKIGNYRNVAGC